MNGATSQKRSRHSVPLCVSHTFGQGAGITRKTTSLSVAMSTMQPNLMSQNVPRCPSGDNESTAEQRGCNSSAQQTDGVDGGHTAPMPDQNKYNDTQRASSSRLPPIAPSSTTTQRRSRTQFPAPLPPMLVFSGGTAFNHIVPRLTRVTPHVSYVLPVSDDGGSTAEIVRVLGGPAVGDIRSRCLRLADQSDSEARAVMQLLQHRLQADSEEGAQQEWKAIVEGKHELWSGISDSYRHIIRRFLISFNEQIQCASLKFNLENGHSSPVSFNLRNGSVGNFFFAAARVYFCSLDAAIFLFSRVARIPEGSRVIPAIQTDNIITLGAQCADGTFIRGQNQISHPPQSSDESCLVDKTSVQTLSSPIQRIMYLSSEGTHQEHEISPDANPAALQAVRDAGVVVYGMGSVYTSLCPSLVLKGVGEAVASRDVAKVLILNGAVDREMSRCLSRESSPMTAVDVVQAVTDALNRRYSPRNGCLTNAPESYVTTVVAPIGGQVEVDEAALREMGVSEVVWMKSGRSKSGDVVYCTQALVEYLGGLVGAWDEEQHSV